MMRSDSSFGAGVAAPPRGRRRLMQKALSTGLALVGGTVYLYLFLYYQPDRTQARLDAWTLSLVNQQQPFMAVEEQQAPLSVQDSSVENSDTPSTTASPSSWLSTLLDWLFFWTFCSVVARLYLQHCIYPRLSRARARTLHQDMRYRRQRFRQWVSRLNRQRETNGQRPLSMESLSLVLRDRELLDGEDYDGLLQFDEEAGPAMEALLNSVGATPQEIERCPLRVLQADDDLLTHNRNAGDIVDSNSSLCPICLEPFVVHDAVRTIPCFHAFHKDCIDPWLAQRAVCPICKHNAIG